MDKSNVSVSRKHILYTVLLCFVIKSIVFLGHTDVTIISDNIGDLALPSFLAGLNWRELISVTSYYGYGFKWVYTIFFWLTDDPYVIYLAIQFLHIVLECILAAVIYSFAVKHWNVKQDAITVLWIAVVISAAGISMNSEGQVYMSFFILCLLVTTLIRTEDIKKKRIYSIVTSAWTCYMLTIHERSLAAIMALAILIVLYRIYAEHWLVELKSFIPSFIVFYFLQEMLTNGVIQFFWSAKSADGTLKNTSVFQSNTLWFIESLENIGILIECAIGNIYTLIIKTYGLGMLAIVFTIISVVSIFIKKKDTINKIFDENKELISILLLSAFTVFIVIVGVAVRWGRLTANGNLTGYKGYTYSRYYLVFAWPGALAVMLLWRRMEETALKTLKVIMAVVTVLLTGFFMGYLYPILSAAYAENKNVHIDRIGFFESITSMDVMVNVYLSIALMLLFVGLLLLQKKKFIVVYTALVVLLVFSVKTKGFDISRPSIGCSQFGASYNLVMSIEDEIELPEEIYYYGSNAYICQYMLGQHSVYDRWASESMNEAIVFSNEDPTGIAPEIPVWGYYYMQLDEDEYFYVKGKALYEQLTALGYLLEPVEQ